MGFSRSVQEHPKLFRAIEHLNMLEHYMRGTRRKNMRRISEEPMNPSFIIPGYLWITVASFTHSTSDESLKIGIGPYSLIRVFQTMSSFHLNQANFLSLNSSCLILPKCHKVSLEITKAMRVGLQ